MESEVNIDNLQNNSLKNIQYLAFLFGFKPPFTEPEKLHTISQIETLFNMFSNIKSKIDNDDNIKLVKNDLSEWLFNLVE